MMSLHAFEAAMHAETLSFLTPRREFSLGTIRDCSMYGDARVYCVWCHAELGDDCESAREWFLQSLQLEISVGLAKSSNP
jgi:hypothetical protein